MEIPEIITIKGRPIPKDTFQFFSSDTQGKRILLTITDSVQTWQEDLSICERLFGDIIVCPFNTSFSHHKLEIEKTREILKQRMKHPEVQGNSIYESIAKTWILPQKLHLGVDASSFFNLIENPIKTQVIPLFKELESEPVIHFLKVEVPNGMERRLLYSFLDEGFRPSIILVKWLTDIDEDIGTAHCAGHLINSGYSLVYFENGYGLYIFKDDSLYDICSLKNKGIENPFLKAILASVSDHLAPSTEKKEDIEKIIP